MRHTRGIVAAIGGLAVLALAGCGTSANPLTDTSPANAGTVVVGSANFPENVLLAEVYAQALEAKGVKVTRQFNIGSREVIYSQIESGALSVLPEYNGALLAYLHKNSTASTTEQVDQELSAALPPSLNLLDPASAQDKDALVVTKATAQKYGLKAIPDLATIASSTVLGGPPEFKSRRQGAVGLSSVYGLTFKDFKALDEAGPITVSALKQNDVGTADLFTTDPSIAANDFVVLQDPKNLFGAQNVIPLVNSGAVNDTARSALNAVSGKLDTAALASLVAKVVVDKQDASDVAREWLKTAALS